MAPAFRSGRTLPVSRDDDTEDHTAKKHKRSVDIQQPVGKCD